MTEQEITQARADIAQLDIEQLRCGVMLQLLNIEALTKERDEYAAAADSMAMQHKVERDALALGVDQWRVDFHELRIERDALAAAVKLALDALEDCRDVLYQVAHGNQACSDAEGVGSTLPDVFEALKKAGVQ